MINRQFPPLETQVKDWIKYGSQIKEHFYRKDEYTVTNGAGIEVSLYGNLAVTYTNGDRSLSLINHRLEILEYPCFNLPHSVRVISFLAPLAWDGMEEPVWLSEEEISEAKSHIHDSMLFLGCDFVLFEFEQWREHRKPDITYEIPNLNSAALCDHRPVRTHKNKNDNQDLIPELSLLPRSIICQLGFSNNLVRGGRVEGNIIEPKVLLHQRILVDLHAHPLGYLYLNGERCYGFSITEDKGQIETRLHLLTTVETLRQSEQILKVKGKTPITQDQAKAGLNNQFYMSFSFSEHNLSKETAKHQYVTDFKFISLDSYGFVICGDRSPVQRE